MKKNLTPKQIVQELNKYIIGQKEAKKAVAIALRNRWRRKQVAENLKKEIIPHNILMVGPTGVGKTEIARRLADLTHSPFIKVEATKFTEVGYVGRDVESIIRDLVEVAVQMTKESMSSEIEQQAFYNAKIKLVEILVGKNATDETKSAYFDKLNKGELDEREVEIPVNKKSPANFDVPNFDMSNPSNGRVGIFNIGEIFEKSLGVQKTKNIKTKVPEALKELTQQEKESLIDQQAVIDRALTLVEEEGIVFLDEIDKIVGGGVHKRSDVNREGVQRDLLPIIEGTTVSTKYGIVKTNHILFISSGAFHLSKPSDLLPELQGRLPIRVELHPLGENDLLSILQEPENSLTKKYEALFNTEGVVLKFSKDGLKEIASLSAKINNEVENIGARRLYTLFEKILEEISFVANEMQGQIITVDKDFVNDRVNSTNIKHKDDLNKFIL